MEAGSHRRASSFAAAHSLSQTAILVCAVAMLSYFASKLGGALVLHPQMLSPLWPGCVLLVSVLLLVPEGSGRSSS